MTYNLSRSKQCTPICACQLHERENIAQIAGKKNGHTKLYQHVLGNLFIRSLETDTGPTQCHSLFCDI